jgi:RNA polymerase sigma-70 factor (ECF subfamily)
MSEENTTTVVQRYLDALAGQAPAEQVVRDLMDRAVRRLQRLCATMLHRNFPRLTRPPSNLQSDELLGAVVERLVKALREARPATVRHFLALAGQHARWELNDLARRLDNQPAAVELMEELVPTPDSSGSVLSPGARRVLEAVDGLPEDEREAFDLVHVQGLSHAEAAELLGVATRTVKRRLDRGIQLLAERLGELSPSEGMRDEG